MIHSVSDRTAEIDISYIGTNLSPIYQTQGISVPLTWENDDKTVLSGDFKWKDNWENSGTGTLKIEKVISSSPKISLNIKVENESDANRATLATNGNKIFTVKTSDEHELNPQ